MGYAKAMTNIVARLVLRLPGDVHAAIAAWAKEEQRSLNSQIVYLLRRALMERQK